MGKKKHFVALCNGLTDEIEWYRDFFSKVLSAQRVLGQRKEKKEIAEMVVLKLCATWESHAEKILVCCASSDTSALASHLDISLPKKSITLDIAAACLFGTNYKDFRSIGELKGYANKVLATAWNPFAKISSGDGKLIDDLFVIRNYLSHYSGASKRAVTRIYGKNHNKGAFREPGTFLVAYDGSLMFKFMDALQNAAGAMKTL